MSNAAEEELDDLRGEGAELGITIVVAPCSGRFAPRKPGPARGGEVGLGDVIGEVVSCGVHEPVTAAVTGRFQAFLARTGERVREGTPVAWLSEARDGTT